MAKTRTVVAVSDLHAPAHDERAVRVALKIIRDIRPTDLVLLGDIVDFHVLSRFLKRPSGPDALLKEIQSARKLISRFCDAAGKAKRHFTPGNHDDRLEKVLLGRVPEFYCLPELNLRSLLHLRGFASVGNHVDIGPVRFIHGYIVRKEAGYSAKAHAQQHGTVCHGHTHRMGLWNLSDRRGEVVAVENGHLSDPAKMDYLKSQPNWQQGLTVWTIKSGHLPSVEMARIYDGVSVLRGKTYRA